MRARSTLTTLKPFRHNQRGQIVLLTVLLLVMAVGLSLYTFVSPSSAQNEIDRKTDAALAQAREALITYAVMHSTQPGRMPCPDTSATFTGSAGSCSSAGSASNRLRRLPWRTLNAPDLRDGYGEQLWYAVSANFLGTAMINSDTTGEYTVTGTQPATNVVAVVFSAGPPMGSQLRNTASVACSTTGTTLARNQCAINYLDGGNSDGNATFVTGSATSAFNDRVVVITQEALIQRLLPRVIGEARKQLNYYFSNTIPANNHFPYASAYSDATRECTNGLLQGRVPLPGSGGAGATPACKDASRWPSFPAWFDSNRWGNYLFYAVSPACASATTSATCLASGGLTVTGLSSNARAVIVATGKAISGSTQVRPCVTAGDCLDDAENINGDTVFVRPVTSSTNNDQLRVVAP